MTEKSLQKSFSQHGVIKYGAVGDVFDPALHDAIFALPDATKTSGNLFGLIFMMCKSVRITFSNSIYVTFFSLLT